MSTWQPSSPAATLWEEIAEVYKTEIAEGKYLPHHPVTSEHTIVLRFGVSRGTARRVITHLQDKQLIYSKVGKGSFLVDPATRDKTPDVEHAPQAGQEPATGTADS